MKKFLAEQLLDFNKNTEDQYDQNWGTILDYVHEDPSLAGNNSNGVDIFQKQMKAKEQQLWDQRAKLDAQQKQTNIQSHATAYHHNEGERLKALVSDANIPSLNIQPLSVTSNDHKKLASEDAMYNGGEESQDYSSPSIDLNRSIQDVTLQQQVSFQADQKHVSTNRNQKPLKLNIQQYTGFVDSSQSKTPTVVGSDILNKINSHIDSMDHESAVSNLGKLKSIVKNQSLQQSNGKARAKIISVTDGNIRSAKKNELSPSTRISGQQSTDKINIRKDGNRPLLLKPDNRRRLTVQQRKLAPNENALDNPPHWNTQQNMNFSNSAAARQKIAHRQQKEAQRSVSPFSQSTKDDAGAGKASPDLLQEPINLSNLQSFNLRNKLFQRLNNFESTQNQQKVFAQLEIENPNDTVDYQESRLNSTQDSLFGAVDFNNTQKFNRTGMSTTNQNCRGTLGGFITPNQPRRITKTQFLKLYGKQLAGNSYMQQTMKIQGELMMQEAGRKTTYFSRPRKSSISMTPVGVHSDGGFYGDQQQQSQSKLLKTAKTASFGGQQQSRGFLKSQYNIDNQSRTESRFTSQPRPAQANTRKSLVQQSNRAMSELRIKDQGQPKIDYNHTRFPKAFLPNSVATQAHFIHQNHHKTVLKKASHNQRKNRGISHQQMRFRSPQMTNIDEHMHTEPSQFEDGHQIEAQDQAFRRFDSEDKLQDQRMGGHNPTSSNLVHLPSQSNAFFASGFNMIDPVHGDLEQLYQTSYQRDRPIDESIQNKLFETYLQGKPDIDRTGHILKQLQMKTPNADINLDKVRKIQQQATNKVAYAYKERFAGIYEEKKRKGQLKRHDSWDRFVNPDKMGLNNYIQHALNTEASEQLKDSLNKDQEPEPPSQNQLMQGDQKSEAESARFRQAPKVSFRNALERFNHQFDAERIQNINDNVTFDRIQKANKRYDVVIQRAKPSLKLYNLLGYSQSQYILFQQVLAWMRNHKYSCEKQNSNKSNVQFAREFFGVIDDSDTGQASLFKLAVPLIALGLSSDSSFIQKVMKAISPRKFGKKAKVANPFEMNQLTLREFIKIFKKDQVSENLIEMLCNRIVERRQTQAIQKKRDLERRQQQLSIVKGQSTFIVNKPMTPSAQMNDYSRAQSTQGAELLEMAVEDSDDMEEFQRTATLQESAVIAVDYAATRTMPSQQTPLKASGKMTTESINKRLDELSTISINEMLAEVREIWYHLDDGQGELEIELRKVSELFSQLQVIADVSSAEKYIQTSIQSKTKVLDYDDFNSIFCKGIFRHAIVGKNRQLEKEIAGDLAAQESKLEFKIIRSKNLILQKELKLGRIERAEEPAQIVKRPILTELWQIFFKNVPREERETYEQFFDRMQGLTDEIINDPASVELDAFAKLHREGNPLPDRNAMNYVVLDHAVMAQVPYAVEEDEIVKPVAVAAPKSQQTTTRRDSKLKKKRSSMNATKRGVSGHSNKLTDSTMKSPRKRTGNQSQIVVKERDTRLDSKSQMSNNTGKIYNSKDSRPDTQGNQSSHRTVASSTKQGGTTFAGAKSSISGVKFIDDDEQDNYLDFKLSEDPEELMLQRKKRFEALRELQGLMTRTELEKPSGTDFLEKIYQQKEEEKRKRYQEAEKNK